jgi:hypothetical protein
MRTGGCVKAARDQKILAIHFGVPFAIASPPSRLGSRDYVFDRVSADLQKHRSRFHQSAQLCGVKPRNFMTAPHSLAPPVNGRSGS